MRVSIRLFLTVILSFTLAKTGLAQETSREKFDREREEILLEEIVVTATRTEKEVRSAPASVSVVTKRDIEKRGARSVDEALNTLPGAYNSRLFQGGVMDSLPSGALTLRGIPGANRTLFMMDGVILNDPYSGSQRSSLAVAPENVERIEVVKGPFSSLYGGYAVGGVVNITTKMPEKMEFTLKTGYGSSWDRGEGLDDLATFYLSCGDKFKDKLSLFLSYGYKATNGYPPDLNLQSSMPTEGITGWSRTTTPQGATRYSIGDRGDKTWWDDNITVKAGYNFAEKTKINFLFTRCRFDYEFDDPHTYLKDASGNPVWSYEKVKEASFLAFASQSRNEYNIYNLNFETEVSDIKIKSSLGMVDRPTSWYVTPDARNATRSGGPGKITSTPSEGYNADIQLAIPPWERHIFTFGGSFRHGWADTEKHNLTDWGDEDSKTTLDFQARGKDRTYALFLQDEIMILENLTAYLGFREDWWETYDGYTNQAGVSGYPVNYPSRNASSFSPKAAIVYKPFKKTTLRTSAGRAFRPPTVYELYSVWIYGGVTTMGGPDLEPETTTSWDIGIGQGLWKGAKIGATYFENYMEDLIYTQTVSPTLNQKVNIGKAESKGVELEMEQRFDNFIRLFANFTYTDSEVTENPAKPSTEGKKLVQVPEKMFNIGGDYAKGPFSVSLVGRYVGKLYNTDDNSDEIDDVYTSHDPYFVADARVSYKLTSFATVSLSVDNIFDEDYYKYYKAPGRSWFGEVTLRF